MYLQQSDRRTTPRVPIRLPVVFSSGEMIHQGFSCNLSMGGMFINHEEDLLVGQRINIRFILPGYDVPIRAAGHVKWRKDPGSSHGGEYASPGCGIVFDRLVEPAKDILNDFISSNEILMSTLEIDYDSPEDSSLFVDLDSIFRDDPDDFYDSFGDDADLRDEETDETDPERSSLADFCPSTPYDTYMN